MRSLFLLLPLLLGGSASAANLPKMKTFLSGPKKLCHPVQCVMIESGIAWLYESKNLDNPLASGILAEETNLGGILAPKGTQIDFPDPENLSSDMDFSLTYRTNAEVGWLVFEGKKPIYFDRFDRTFGPGKSWKWTARTDSITYVEGTLARKGYLDGVDIDAGGVNISGKVNEKGGIQEIKLIRAIVAANTHLAADYPIELHRGEVVTLLSDVVYVKGPPREFGAAKIVGSNTSMFRKTGALISLRIAVATKIHDVRVHGQTLFHQNGRIHRSSPASESQTLSGIVLKGNESDRLGGEVDFYESGIPRVVPSTLVDTNARFLPEKFARALPAELKGRNDCLWFFFNAKGELKALVVSAHDAPTPLEEAYVVSPDGKGLKFTLLTPRHSLGFALLEAKTHIPKSVEAYLTNGIVPKK